MPEDAPKFIDVVESIYQDKFVIHPYCDVYWKFERKWLQVLLLAPLFDGEQLYKAYCFDGESIEKYVLHKDWYCTVLWFGD